MHLLSALDDVRLCAHFCSQSGGFLRARERHTRSRCNSLSNVFYLAGDASRELLVQLGGFMSV
jgi:hypothetical protein